VARLLRMPEVAANTTSAVLSDWPVPENVEFAVDEPIATVETEKAVVDVPADAAGVILRTLVVAGAEVEVGAPIAVIGDPGEVVDDIDRLVVELGGTPAVAEPEPTRSAVVEPTPPRLRPLPRPQRTSPTCRTRASGAPSPHG
jgi:pyruvate dehydrogenase E2 component (dihydrolipoamide acetyltransferase)